jgi:hypothetical protein
MFFPQNYINHVFSNPQKMELLLNFTLNEKQIDEITIIEAYHSGSLRHLEDARDVRIIISDLKFIYATEIDVYNKRMQMSDVMLGLPISMQITLLNTCIHENNTRDGIKYTFGNIYGANSVLCGARFSTLISEDIFKSLVGKKLKNVILNLVEGQYRLTNYELRD